MNRDQGDDLTTDVEAYYRGLAEKPATIVRFFDRRDFYYAFGEDARFVALEIRKTNEALKKSRTGLDYVIVNQNQFESEVRELLLVRQYRVQMYNKESGGWRLQYECSPGNFGPLEDILYSSRDNLDARGLIAIAHTDLCFAVVHMDTICKTIRIAHFADDVNLCTLESVLVQLSPKEAILPHHSKLKHQIIEKLQLNQVTDSVVSGKEYFVRCDIKNTAQFLLLPQTNLDLVIGCFDASKLFLYAYLVSDCVQTVPEQERVLVEEALSAATKYLSLMVDSAGLYEMTFVTLSRYMKLDAAAVSALNLFPVQRGGRISFSKDKRSVFGLLNKCRTLPGQRLLSQWIRQPLVDIQKINERLTLVEHFIDHPDRRTTISDQRLRGIPDLVRLSRKLQQKTVKLQECYSLYRLIQSLPQLLLDIGGEDNPYVRVEFNDKIDRLRKNLTDPGKFTSLMEEVLDFEKVRQREFRVNPKFSQELRVAAQKVDELEVQVQSIYRTALKDLSLPEKNLKLTNDDEKGYFFSVTNTHEKSIRNQPKYFMLQSGKKGGIPFSCKQLDEFNVQYMEEKKALIQEENRILAEFRVIASGYAVYIRQVSDVLTHMDVIVALAIAAASACRPYVRPELLRPGSGVLSLQKLRHPCVESEDNNFIANDVCLTSDSQKFKLVTGPNMGGKSTYIRSAAIAILMAQMGSFVPADEAKISVMDGLFTRVGASDKQLRGNSTFMNEMVETAAILRSATENSFIIIDELGRGTSTFDGYGIAYAVSQHIARELRSFCLFATHFRELAELGKEPELGIGNLHVAVHEADECGKGILLLFEVRSGISAQSYGIHTAKAAAFPPDMISLAEAKLAELGQGLSEHDADAVVKRIAFVDPDSEEDIRRLVTDIRNANFTLPCETTE